MDDISIVGELAQSAVYLQLYFIAQVAVMSAFLGPDQAATEALLATDPDVAPWVQKYQRSRETVSQTDYEVNNQVFHFSFVIIILYQRAAPQTFLILRTSKEENR